jgi:hypothetical protein
VERDGKYLVIKGKKAKEAEAEVKKWLRKIKVMDRRALVEILNDVIP